MKKLLLFLTLLTVLALTAPLLASAEQQPEMIVEKMALKFSRGVANTFTSIAELPKQTVLTVRDMGTTGYLIGPLKGIGMTLYRGFIGVTEAVFFMVPQPGYYDPMIDPKYVWEGWDAKRETATKAVEEK
ncbi:MAG TPA: exosortase system-associated protein, TIGR04073 family [Desulfuromonadales bacterium]|nr:exosortase system-associated protein, TIGR04073 family [Desulfuromonadales bacterium]